MSSVARKFLVWLGLIGLMWTAPASASLRVNPLIVYMSPDGRSSSAVVQLTNVTDVQLPFEVNVVKRTVVDGQEVDVPADDDFVIFPPQMIISPAETQTLRIQWVAGGAPTRSESYYVYVTQVPVQVQEGVSGIRVSYRFGISVHVVPANVLPGLEVLAVRPTTKEGVRGFEMDVHNAGARFGRLSEHELVLDGSHTWDRQALNDAVGTGFMLPDERTTFFVPFDGPVTSTSSATLTSRGPA